MIGRVMVEGLLQNAEELAQAAVHADTFVPVPVLGVLSSQRGRRQRKLICCDHDTIMP